MRFQRDKYLHLLAVHPSKPNGRANNLGRRSKRTDKSHGTQRFWSTG